MKYKFANLMLRQYISKISKLFNACMVTYSSIKYFHFHVHRRYYLNVAVFIALLLFLFSAVEAIAANNYYVSSSRVSQSSDDAEEIIATGTIVLNSSDLELISDAPNNVMQTVGLRFQNVPVPQGAIITNAYIEFETDETSSVYTYLIFYGEDTSNSPPFDLTRYNISHRTKTAAFVTWNNVVSWDSVNQNHKTPDLSQIIQEIVDRSDWQSSNALSIIVTGSGTRIAEAYDGESTNAPLLTIEYQSDIPPPPSRCIDGIDNDGDGLIDYPEDTGCLSSRDNSETDISSLNEYIEGSAVTDINFVSDNLSGITYVPESNTFFLIQNSGGKIWEVDASFNHVRTISISGFGDSEDIVYVGNNEFAIVNENANLYIGVISSGARNLYAADFQRIAFDAYSGNQGPEGVAYNRSTQTFYIVKEKNPMKLYRFVKPSTTRDMTIAPEYPFNAQELLSYTVTDLSAILFDSRTGRLLILSDESNKIIDVGLDGYVYGELSVPDMGQPEGVAFDDDFNVFVAGEQREYQIHLYDKVYNDPTPPGAPKMMSVQ